MRSVNPFCDSVHSWRSLGNSSPWLTDWSACISSLALARHRHRESESSAFVASSAEVELLEPVVLLSGTPVGVIGQSSDGSLFSEVVPSQGTAGPQGPEEVRLSGFRWTSTATNGSGIVQGAPITLTWSIADDGTPIPGFEFGPDGNSDLIAFFDGIRGSGPGGADLTQRPWFGVIKSSFDRLSALSGITYVYEPNDDGAAFSSSLGVSDGVLGVRGDVRIGGHFIDGVAGLNILAFNFFPTIGDQIIDTSNLVFFADTSNNSIGLRNTLLHETGHGLGLDHVNSSDQNFLMEPVIGLSFDGPQHDDILGIQRYYGDSLEKQGGDTEATAINLGELTPGTSINRGTLGDSAVVGANDVDFLSIDDESDADWFRFNIASDTPITITLTPRGLTYQEGPEGGPESPFNSKAQSDLRLEGNSPNGSFFSNITSAGGNEVFSGTLNAGEHFLRVNGLTADVIQMYGLEISAPPPPSSIFIVDDGDVGFSQTGAWSNAPGVGFGADVKFKAAGTGTATSTWTFNGLVAGRYRVSTTWKDNVNRAPNTPYRILDGAGGAQLARTLVDQRPVPRGFTADGAAWQDLGIVTIRGGTLQVVMSDLASFGVVIADAVRIERLASIIDDGEAGFALSGPWTNAPGVGRNGDLKFANPSAGPTAPIVASWTFSGLTSGKYRVSATWKNNANRATNAPFTVHRGEFGPQIGSATINQVSDPNDFVEAGVAWEDLGQFDLVGGVLQVQLTNIANGVVIADAIRVERMTAIVDDGDFGFSTTSGWTNAPGVGFTGDVKFTPGGAGANVATWRFRNLEAGVYRVSATWKDNANRATNAPFTIRAGVGGTVLGSATINQQPLPNDFTDAGAAWENLSEVNFVGGELVVTLSNNANGVVIADAIRVDRIGAIVDDLTPAFATTAIWFTETTGGRDGDFLRGNPTPDNSVARWFFEGLRPGTYRVSATWVAGTNRATNAPFTVRRVVGGQILGSSTENQQIAPNDFTALGSNWEEVANVTTQGNSLVVELTNSGNGWVIADAVRIQRLSPVYAPVPTTAPAVASPRITVDPPASKVAAPRIAAPLFVLPDASSTLETAAEAKSTPVVAARQPLALERTIRRVRWANELDADLSDGARLAAALDRSIAAPLT